MTSSSNAYEVEQCDRDAAADLAETIQGWCNIGGNDVAAIRNGFWDTDQDDLGALIQAFAKHRHEKTSALGDPEVSDVEVEAALTSEGIYVYGPDAERFERMFAVVMRTRLALRTGGVDNG